MLYGFNNQLRFNSQGKFNLPVGKRDYNGSSRRNIAGFNSITSEKNIDFQVGDFSDILKYTLSENDFIYCDPPYFLGLATYNENGGWSVDDELTMYKVLDKLNQQSVKFALSNVTEHKGEKNTGLVKWATQNKYNIHKIAHDYKNSNYQSNAKHGITQEVLITNY
jgi:site-specific DNA-adenine methylase